MCVVDSLVVIFLQKANMCTVGMKWLKSCASCSICNTFLVVGCFLLDCTFFSHFSVQGIYSVTLKLHTDLLFWQKPLKSNVVFLSFFNLFELPIFIQMLLQPRTEGKGAIAILMSLHL